MKNICIFVPTANRPEMLEEVLKFERDYYLKSGIDVVIYDSGDGPDTQRIVEECVENGYTNIKYKQTPNGQCIDYKTIEILSKDTELLEYDYLWMINDSISILPDSLDEVIRYAEGDFDLIRLPIEGSGDKEDYITTDVDDWFHKCSKGMAHMGSTIMSTRLLSGNIDWDRLCEKYVGSNDITAVGHGFFFMVGFYLEQIAQLASFRGLQVGNRRKWRRDSPLKRGKSYWNHLVFEAWARSYVETILRTPEIYTDKADVIRTSDNMVFGRFERQSLISFRIQGLYSIAEYEKYKNYWPYVTSLQPQELREIAEKSVDDLKKEYGENYGQIDRWSENLTAIVKDIGSQKIIVYGAGLYGEYSVGQLQRDGYENQLLGVAVSDASKNVETVNGQAVRDIDFYADYKASALVLIATLPDTARVIYRFLSDKGFQNIRFLF